MSGGSRDVKMQMQNKEKHRLTIHACLPAASMQRTRTVFSDFNGTELHIARVHRRGVSLFGLQVSPKFVKNELSQDLSEANERFFSWAVGSMTIAETSECLWNRTINSGLWVCLKYRSESVK